MKALKNRGAEGLLIAAVDGLRGFPRRSTPSSPDATTQTSITSLLRNNQESAAYKDPKAVTAALKGICRAVDAVVG